MLHPEVKMYQDPEASEASEQEIYCQIGVRKAPGRQTTSKFTYSIRSRKSRYGWVPARSYPQNRARGSLTEEARLELAKV